MKRLALLLAVIVGLVGVRFASATQLAVTSGSLTTLRASIAQPAALGLALANGGTTAGRADTGDTVAVTFPAGLDATSMCSTWTNGAAAQIAGNNAVTVTITDGGSANDTLTVATTCTGWAFGTVDLGSTGFVTATATFRGNGNGSRSVVSYDPATRSVVVTLGARASGTVGTVGSVTATFTPSTSLLWQDGTTVAPLTGSTTGVVL